MAPASGRAPTTIRRPPRTSRRRSHRSLASSCHRPMARSSRVPCGRSERIPMRVHRWFARATRAAVAAVFLLGSGGAVRAQALRDRVPVAPSSLMELRRWDAQTERMLRDRDLRIRDRHEDKLIPGRLIERADQYYNGVRVFGGDVARQLQGGVLISVFGMLYPNISVDTVARIDADRAREIVEAKSGAELSPP